MTSRRGDVATWRRRDVTVTSLPALHCSKNCFQKLLVTPHRTCIQNKQHIRNLNTKNYIINIKSHGNKRLTRVEYECFRHSSSGRHRMLLQGCASLNFCPHGKIPLITHRDYQGSSHTLCIYFYIFHTSLRTLMS